MSAPKTYLDDLFEGKNTRYGAYPLRQNHLSILAKALGGSMLSVGLLWVVPMLYQQLLAPEEDQKKPALKVVPYAHLEAPPPIEEPPPPPEYKAPPKPKKTRKFTEPVVKPDEEVQEAPMPTQEELSEVATGSEDVVGDTSGAETTVQGDTLHQEPTSEEPFVAVEHMPEFPGGTQALLRYLRSHIQYPEIARELGIEGRVVVQFVIHKDGSISSVEVVRGVAPVLDEEAIRVVQAMPPWKPGRQRDRAVPVRYAIPINFRLSSP